MKKNNFNISDTYIDDEKSKIFRKEMRKADPYYWLMIIMGIVLAYVVAIINKQ